MKSRSLFMQLPVDKSITHENFLPSYSLQEPLQPEKDILPPAYSKVLCNGNFCAYCIKSEKDFRPVFTIHTAIRQVSIALSTNRPLLELQLPDDADMDSLSIRKERFGKDYIVSVEKRGKYSLMDLCNKALYTIV